MRLFIAILLTEQIKEILDQNAKEIRKYANKGRLTEKENYHITLRFLGEVPESGIPSLQKVLAATAGAAKAFELILHGMGEFKKMDGSIVWLGLKENPPALLKLHEHLENALSQAGYMKENRPFSPHITMLRQARLLKPLLEIPVTEKDMLLKVKEIALMESCRISGKLTYIPLALFPLGKTD